jgi:hypothetical protein
MTRRQLREVEKALEAGDLVAAHRIVYGFSAADERVLEELDRRLGQRSADTRNIEG